MELDQLRAPARRTLSLALGLGPMFTPLSGCSGQSGGAGSAPDETGSAPASAPAPQPCARPGLLHTEADLQRMADKVAAGEEPLFYVRDPAPPAGPSGLSAFLTGGKVQLSWWRCAGASQYLVQRAASAQGPFTTIAEVTEPRSYTDQPAAGTWHYRISAHTAEGDRVGAETARVAVPGELWLHLPLNGNADDATGLGRHGQLVDGTSWGEGRNGGTCVVLDGASGHVRLPDGVVSTLGDFTIAVWAYWEAAAVNARIFDFGSTDVAYMALSPRDGGGQLRFMSSGNQWWAEEAVTAPMLPTGRWVHLAVTLSGTVGTLYVDGSAVASQDRIWLAPHQFGQTSRTWLGRSQYGGDPFFEGRLQDFRIYSGALDAAAIAALAR